MVMSSLTILLVNVITNGDITLQSTSLYLEEVLWYNILSIMNVRNVENNMGQVIDINAVLDMKRFVRKHDLQAEATEEAIEDGTRLILKYGDDFFLGFIEMYMEELVRRNKK